MLAFDHDRRLAAVRVGDPRTSEMQRGDDRLRGVGADLRQDAVEALAAASKLSERIVDAGRPVDAGDDLRGLARDQRCEAVAMNAEGELDHARNAVGLAVGPVVGERLRIAAGRFHAGGRSAPCR